MASLLTLPARALPLACPAKEFAVLVLLPVSACRVVFADGIGPVGVGVRDAPQPASKHERHSDPRVVKHGKAVVFTETFGGNFRGTLLESSHMAAIALAGSFLERQSRLLAHHLK